MDSSVMWGDHEDPILSAPPHEDFQQFLDMNINNLSDSLHFEFPEFDSQPHVQLQQNGGESMDTHMDGQNHMHQMKDVVMQEQHPINAPTSNHSTIPNTPIDSVHGSHESLVELDAQIQYLQQQRQQQQQRAIQEQQRNYYAQNNMVPPTPNSIEMHGGASSFYMTPESQQQQQYNRFQVRQKEQDMSFTPLVSPAVTPLETQFHMNDFTMPGAYFSPLSSPALHAQNEHRTVQEARRNEHSTTTSPIEFNNESQPSGGAKKATRKAAAKPRNPRAVRQSPIVKPQRRKGGSTVIPPQTLAEIVEPGAKSQPSSNGGSGQSVPSTDVSENGSISPEHLSDTAMAPPPLPQPGSARNSPYLVSQAKGRAQSLSVAEGGLSPATPASLMRLMKPPSSGEQQSPAMPSQENVMDDHMMDDFALPEAASADTAKPELSRIDTTSDGQTTPTLNSASKTPGFQPLPSPVFVRPTIAASQSPRIFPTPDNIRKTPNLLPRGAKKRGSVSSVHVSPALRPRISPSIKPLLPGGGSVSDDTASLLLASKSNYQNILEGTHLPGVSYPTELSTNLTSKRTSHKIAEQGRRNRINSALQEIATLLPQRGKDSSGEKSCSGDGEDAKDVKDANDAKDAKESKAAQSAGSKASTVEQAIEYIKLLKQQVADANARAEEAEKKLADVKS